MSKHRDLMGDPFASGEVDEFEASDPMSGLANLADCMLVLACGLMVTLVAFWNLDLSPHYEVVEETGKLVTIEESPELAVRESKEANPEDDNVFENMGALYRDPRTGKMYYLREWNE